MVEDFLELSAIVKGHVQGVGFRAATKKVAQQLKVIGFVRNLKDGSVEICAQGKKERLEQLLTKLREEFSSHCIQDIVCNFHSARVIYSDFQIV
jgi:acylphosphatase